VYIRFELPTEIIEFERDGGKVSGPMSIGQRFTASMNAKANLRKFIEGWFGKKFPTDQAAADFDLMQLVDKKCLLNVTHNEGAERTYANISGASPIPKGMASNYKRVNPALMFDLAAPDDDAFQAMPNWLQTLISKHMAGEAKAAPAKNGGKPAGNLPGYQFDQRIARTDTGLRTGQDVEFDDEIPF
jgi:hypothetical protein